MERRGILVVLAAMLRKPMILGGIPAISSILRNISCALRVICLLLLNHLLTALGANTQRRVKHTLFYHCLASRILLLCLLLGGSHFLVVICSIAKRSTTRLCWHPIIEWFRRWGNSSVLVIIVLLSNLDEPLSVFLFLHEGNKTILLI